MSKIQSHAANNTIIVQTQQAIHQRRVRKPFIKQTQSIQRDKKPVLNHGCGYVFVFVCLIGTHVFMGLRNWLGLTWLWVPISGWIYVWMSMVEWV